MKDKERKVEEKYGFLVIDGKYHQKKMKRGKIEFIPIDEKKVQERIRKVKVLARKLKEGLDGETILIEVLMKIQDEDLENLYNLAQSKRKYKPKTRKHYCVDMTYGNFIIPIVE